MPGLTQKMFSLILPLHWWSCMVILPRPFRNYWHIIINSLASAKRTSANIQFGNMPEIHWLTAFNITLTLLSSSSFCRPSNCLQILRGGCVFIILLDYLLTVNLRPKKQGVMVKKLKDCRQNFFMKPEVDKIITAHYINALMGRHSHENNNNIRWYLKLCLHPI